MPLISFTPSSQYTHSYNRILQHCCNGEEECTLLVVNVFKVATDNKGCEAVSSCRKNMKEAASGVIILKHVYTVYRHRSQS